MFVFLGFLGLMNVYSLRVNLSVALVAMVKNKPSKGLDSNHSECMYGLANETGSVYSNGTEIQQTEVRL